MEATRGRERADIIRSSPCMPSALVGSHGLLSSQVQACGLAGETVSSALEDREERSVGAVEEFLQPSPLPSHRSTPRSAHSLASTSMHSSCTVPPIVSRSSNLSSLFVPSLFNEQSSVAMVEPLLLAIHHSVSSHLIDFSCVISCQVALRRLKEGRSEGCRAGDSIPYIIAVPRAAAAASAAVGQPQCPKMFRCMYE